MEPKRRRKQYKGWMRSPCPQAPRSTEHDFVMKRKKQDNLILNASSLHTSSESEEEDERRTNWNDEILENLGLSSLAEENDTRDDITSSPYEDSDLEIPFLMDEAVPTTNQASTEEPTIIIDAAERMDHVENSKSNEDEGLPRMPDLETPIHPSLKTTKFECLLMILTFSLRHGLTFVGIEDLCKLVNRIIQSEAIPTSKYMFNKVFCSGLKYRFHFICSECEAYVGEFDQGKTISLCPVCGKECQTKNMNDGNFFISLPIEEQLIFLLENTEDILDHLEYRWRRKLTEDSLQDMYDGTVYKNLSKNGEILSYPHNMSITFNTDGAVLFDSRKNSLWPIHFRINELPPKIRFNQANSMVAGIWFGKSEPNMAVFLSAFVTEAKKLFETAFKWSGPAGTIQSKVVVLNCVVDSKAKPPLQCVKQFNGYFGCGYCYHPGVVLDEGSNQAKYVMENQVSLLENKSCKYKVTKPDKVYSVKDRTNTKMRIDMVEAENNRKRSETGRVSDINGVKGISPLYFLPWFDVVFGFPIDYMHAVLLGVTKLVASLWLDSSSHQKNYYIGNKVEIIDERLANIKPPSSISRRPRGISERVHWKANEWRAWLLFYSLPCLCDILQTKYLKHHCILATAIQILLQNNITSEELESASWYLIEYVLEFQRLYGAQFMHYNVHLLLHLGRCVFSWGPLWCYSAFSFEAANGSLLKMVKGTRAVTSQIAYRYSVCKFIPKAIKMYQVSDNVLEYCDDLMCYRTASLSSKCDSLTLLGSQKIVKFTVEEQTLLKRELNGYIGKCSFERMIKDSVMFHARCYTRRGAKSNDSVIKLLSGTYGMIEKILKYNIDDEGPKIFLIVRTINIVGNQNVINHQCGAKAPHIRVASAMVYGNLKLVCADQIKEKVILITTVEKTYVAVFPNVYEKD